MRLQSATSNLAASTSGEVTASRRRVPLPHTFSDVLPDGCGRSNIVQAEREAISTGTKAALPEVSNWSR